MDWLMSVLHTVTMQVLEHLPAIIGAVFAALMVGVTLGVRKLNITQEFKNALIDFVQRGLDKTKANLALATDPASPGGAALTTEELSALRDEIYGYVKDELKGSLAKLALSWGEQRIKGFVGRVLKERGIVPTPAGDALEIPVEVTESSV